MEINPSSSARDRRPSVRRTPHAPAPPEKELSAQWSALPLLHSSFPHPFSPPILHSSSKSSWLCLGAGAPVTVLAAGGEHTCALRSDGGVMCWGWNTYGQLGIGGETDADIPATVTLSGRPDPDMSHSLFSVMRPALLSESLHTRDMANKDRARCASGLLVSKNHVITFNSF